MIIASQDSEVLEMAGNIGKDIGMGIQIFNYSNNPLDLMTRVCTINPAVLIMDDDFLSPNSAHTLESIKQVNRTTAIIFLTSDTSIELGRSISQLGIHYYGIKPVDKEDLRDAVSSLKEIRTQP